VARTEEGAELTQEHRLLQVSIGAATVSDLLGLWDTVDPLNLAGTIAPFAAAAAVIVRARNRDSATAAARYFGDFRAAEGVRGAATIVAGEPPVAAVVAGLVRGAGLSGIVRARQRGFSAEAAARNGFTRVAGSSTNLVLDGGRQVVIEATLSDRASTGKWQRVASSGACAWCAMQASRGPVFNERAFKKHVGCNCDAEPVYEGSRLPPTSRQFRDEWNRAQREIGPDVSGTNNDALTAFRRLREGRPLDGRRASPVQPEVA
jgi:hypothetical protein